MYWLQRHLCVGLFACVWMVQANSIFASGRVSGDLHGDKASYCYRPRCLSVCLSVTLVNHAFSVQDIEIPSRHMIEQYFYFLKETFYGI